MVLSGISVLLCVSRPFCFVLAKRIHARTGQKEVGILLWKNHTIPFLVVKPSAEELLAGPGQDLCVPGTCVGK